MARKRVSSSNVKQIDKEHKNYKKYHRYEKELGKIEKSIGKSIPETDLRSDYDERTKVKDGTLYRKGSIVQVWWDKMGKETWSSPSEEQAKSNFKSMKERWNE